MSAAGDFAIPPPYAALLALLAFALVVGAIGLALARKERRACDLKAGWDVRRLRVNRLACRRCRAQYADGDYVWRDPEGRLVCHVSCDSPGSLQAQDALAVSSDLVSDPVAEGRVVAAFAPPPVWHNWSNPAPGCGYAHLQSGDKPQCTCPDGRVRSADFKRTVISKPGAVIHVVAVEPPEWISKQLYVNVPKIGDDDKK